MSAKYQVYKDAAGKYRFRLRAANNKIVAVSEAYERKAGCINGIQSVQKNCGAPVEDKTVETEPLTHPKYEIFMDTASKYRFNLSASNGEIIAASEGYETKASCMNGIEAVQRSCDAEIEDLTETQMEKMAPAMAPVAVGEDAGESHLELYCPPTSVNWNTIVTFEGKLKNKDTGKPIAGAEVGIWEKDRSFMGDDVLVSGMTKGDGTYSIDWKAKQQDWWDDSVEVYAWFAGNENYTASKTEPRKIRVLIHLRNKE
ncbi:MAG: DUF1508 domain-containing protein [Candidatus Bathyarchaeota archaeon]|nr:DUF1508 domain-containing protein [Candidatus Bathyarchaeota archaeon]